VALKGNLRDLGVVEVIQLLHTVHQTGRLVLTSDHQQAWLHYRKGQLVDARTGNRTGTEALVEIVDWSSGEFEFEPGVAPQEETIQMELLHVIMRALKIRDERKEAERLKAETELQLRASQSASLSEELAAFVAGTDIVVYAGLADASGVLLAETRTAKAPPGMDQLRGWLLELAKSHPGPEFKKVFVEDEVGTAVIARAGAGRIAIVVADKSVPFGAVSLWVNKLVVGVAARTPPQSEAALAHAI
jgi:hypothetical protein